MEQNSLINLDRFKEGDRVVVKGKITLESGIKFLSFDSIEAEIENKFEVKLDGYDAALIVRLEDDQFKSLVEQVVEKLKTLTNA